MLDIIEELGVAQHPNLARVAKDMWTSLADRGVKLSEELLDKFRNICLSAIDEQIAVKPRVELAHSLGRITDPRVPVDFADDSLWVRVSKGTYQIGDAGIQGEYYSKRALDPQSAVLKKKFCISRYPVTNAQFAEFVNAGGYQKLAQAHWRKAGWKWREQNGVTQPEYWDDVKWNGPTQPVVGVNWFEANAFAKWAGARLPTEIEWEIAAPGKDSHTYPWGPEWIDEICNSYELGVGATTPVGTFPASVSHCGACDMAGNVWEWCTDKYDASNKKSDAGRVLRGGS